MIDYSRVMRPDLPFVIPDDYQTEQEAYESEMELGEDITVKHDSVLGLPLRMQRIEDDLTIRELEKVIGIGFALISKYENGMMEPFPKHFHILIDYFAGKYEGKVKELHQQKKLKKMQKLQLQLQERGL